MSSKIILIGNEKGGVGKTTTVLNVGEALARAGEKVLLVDLDPSGNLTHTLTKLQPDLRAAAKVTADHIVDIDPETRKPAAEAILDAVRPGVDLIAAPANAAHLIAAEKNVTNDPIEGPHVLRESLEPIRDRYDYILIDCSPTRNALEMCALVAADQLIVLNEAHDFSIAAMQGVTSYAQSIKKRHNSTLWVRGTILNKVQSGTVLARSWTTQFTEAGIPVLGSVHSAEPIKRSVNDGVSLTDTKDGWRHLWVYDDLATTITQRKKP